MDIYERLKKDHDKQRELARQIIETTGDSEERRQLWQQFKIELEAHASAEEQTFYATLMEQPDGSDKARHSVAEHKDAADLVEEIDDMDMSSSGWQRKFSKLKEEVEHHVDEEEEEVFKLARKLISAEEARDLAGRFEERKGAEVDNEKDAA